MKDNTFSLQPFLGTVSRIAMVALIGAVLSGCGLSSLTSGLGSSVFGGGSNAGTTDVADVNEAKLLSAAQADASNSATGSIDTQINGVSAGCPKVIVRARDNHMTIYEEGRAGDSLGVRHRGEITKTARECTIEPGRVTVKYGFSGRVLLGPRGTSGNVALPVSVAVADASRATVASDQVQVATDITVEKPIGYFSAVRTVTFNLPEGSRPGDFSVYLAFPQAAQAPGTG